MSVYQQFKHKGLYVQIQSPDKVLRGAGGNPLPVGGMFQGTLKYADRRETTETVYVVENLHMPLLSRPAMITLKLLTLHLDSIFSIESAKSEYPKLYEGLGNIKIGQ